MARWSGWWILAMVCGLGCQVAPERPAPLGGGAAKGLVPPDRGEVPARLLERPADATYSPFEWPSRPPADCPFPPSEEITGIVFTGRHAEYDHVTADCWFPSWASDGNLYSGYSDGAVENHRPDGTIERVETWGGRGDESTTGHGMIIGDDPMDLTIVGLGAHPAPPHPYHATYPSGSLVHDGIWYYGFHPEGPSAWVHLDDEPYQWPWIGPFTGFRVSHDYGRTWTPAPYTPSRPLIDEPALDAEGTPKGVPIQIGEPFFVDFGRNMEHSPDGKAYLVAHGATEFGEDPRLLKSSWCIGDHAYLLRVTPSPETIHDPAAYEFFAGHDERGEPVWTRDRSEMRPLIEWEGRVGCTAMTYHPGLGRYLMCVTDGREANGPYDTFILESEDLTGPWRMVVFMKRFGEQAYFVNIPAKFISGDRRTLWLVYSANFSGWQVPLGTVPAGSRYGLNLQEVRLVLRGDRR